MAIKAHLYPKRGQLNQKDMEAQGYHVGQIQPDMYVCMCVCAISGIFEYSIEIRSDRLVRHSIMT